jgi:hypothetical protein
MINLAGYCEVLSLEETKEVIDYMWDNILNYANNNQNNW